MIAVVLIVCGSMVLVTAIIARTCVVCDRQKFDLERDKLNLKFLMGDLTPKELTEGEKKPQTEDNCWV